MFSLCCGNTKLSFAPVITNTGNEIAANTLDVSLRNAMPRNADATAVGVCSFKIVCKCARVVADASSVKAFGKNPAINFDVPLANTSIAVASRFAFASSLSATDCVSARINPAMLFQF